MGNRGINTQGSQYTDDDRRRAIAVYVMSGNGADVSRKTGIPESTISDWQSKEWWATWLGDIRREKTDELDAIQTGLIHAAYDQMMDRLANGDHRLLKDGTPVRVPVNYRDLSVGAAIAYDKRALGRGDPTARVERLTVTVQLERLNTYFKQATADDQIQGLLDKRPIEGTITSK